MIEVDLTYGQVLPLMLVTQMVKTRLRMSDGDCTDKRTAYTDKARARRPAFRTANGVESRVEHASYSVVGTC